MAYIGSGLTRFNTADDLTVTDDAEIGGDLTVTGSADINGGTIKLDGNYPVGTNNVALGDAALDSAESGAIANLAVGHQAGTAITTGDENTAIGNAALQSNTTASNNTAIGSLALQDNTGSNNTAVGKSALAENTTGSFSTAVGYLAGQNATASGTVAVGHSSAKVNTGAGVTAVGSNALLSNTSGTNNTAVGNSGMENNTTGGSNTAIGREALQNNTTASNNTAVGYQAGYNGTTAARNTIVGYQAGYALTNGSDNTFVGINNGVTGSAGSAITTGSKNTIIGAYNGNQGGVDIRTSSNNIVLSDGDGNPRVHVISSGQLVKNGDSGTARILPETDNAGYIGQDDRRWQAIYAVNGSIQTSDERQKTDIQDSQLGLDFISALRPVSYKWISGGKHFEYDEDGNPTITDVAGKRNHYGLLAQEVKEALGDVDFGGWVITDLNDPESAQSLRYDQFIAPLIKAVQEQQETITALKARVEALENQ